MVWNSWVIEHRLLDDDYILANSICVWSLIAISIWFILTELIQGSKDMKKYIFSTSNTLDLLPNVLVLWNTIGSWMSNGQNAEYPEFWRIQAFAGIFLSLKFLFFLRIFEYTGHLIYMVSRCIVELVPFMIVLVVSIIGFTEAFLSLNKSYPLDKQDLKTFTESFYYSLLLALGEFGLDNLDAYGWVLFISAATFNLVILLNLVIAIISDVFTRVLESQIRSFYKERCDLIAEVGTLIPILVPEKTAKTALLFFATEHSAK